ncbi:MAG: hypothetical protein AAF649_12025 [Verrucomicrobiota bacterium]
MPQQDKSAPQTSSGRSEYEGNEYPTDSAQALEQALRFAFDYRGDVTIRLKDQSEVTGFVHNFDLQNDLVNLFITESKRQSSDGTIPASAVASIFFSGDDKAFGKSWEDWMAKSERQRLAEADRLEKESKEMGHL